MGKAHGIDLILRRDPRVRTPTRKLENGKAFSSQGILNILEKSENLTQNTENVRIFMVFFL